jgi:putative glutathione S-transferase
VQIVTSTGQSNQYGWGFEDQPNHEDPVTKAKFLSEFYFNADPDYDGRATVPSLVDTTTNKIVNNDYHRLTNYFEVAFEPWQAEDAPDLYPEHLRKEIDILNDWLFPNINNAHYRMAFSQSLTAYNEAYDDFFNAMDKLEERLEYNRFLFGDYVTDSDARFFVTLARWDSYYYRNLGPQKKRMTEYRNIWAYARDLYEIPAFKNNTYFKDFSREPKNSTIFNSYNAKLNKIAARWPAKAVVQFLISFLKKQ